MYVVKMTVRDENWTPVEWKLNGFDHRPLRFVEYRHAEREAEYQRQKHSTIEGFTCQVVEEKNE